MFGQVATLQQHSVNQSGSSSLLIRVILKRQCRNGRLKEGAAESPMPKRSIGVGKALNGEDS